MADDADATDDEVTQEESDDTSRPRRRSPITSALGVGLAALVALAGLAGWTGYRVYDEHKNEQRSQAFLEVARQGAVNLTTIDYRKVDEDVARILDSASGTFYDDFQSRAKPFVDVVKQARSTSEGTVIDAGMESESASDAQVLVAVKVKTTVADGTPQDPRSWRMRISVQKTGADEYKVSNVTFVP
ncbi:MAG: tetratricopeptide repeat protein [Mycobacterium kyogaense]|uniref:tetratricopeptide repeat protein n=1 Tax=Mycobacterium kyogaense TaxID=2212479 RepID=UPI002FFBDC75